VVAQQRLVGATCCGTLCLTSRASGSKLHCPKHLRQGGRSCLAARLDPFSCMCAQHALVSAHFNLCMCVSTQVVKTASFLAADASCALKPSKLHFWLQLEQNYVAGGSATLLGRVKRLCYCVSDAFVTMLSHIHTSSTRRRSAPQCACSSCDEMCTRLSALLCSLVGLQHCGSLWCNARNVHSQRAP
jgi:hypothetical protein